MINKSDIMDEKIFTMGPNLASAALRVDTSMVPQFDNFVVTITCQTDGQTLWDCVSTPYEVAGGGVISIDWKRDLTSYSSFLSGTQIQYGPNYTNRTTGNSTYTNASVSGNILGQSIRINPDVGDDAYGYLGNTKGMVSEITINP